MGVDGGGVGGTVNMFDNNILKNNVGSTIAVSSSIMSVTFIVRMRVAVHLRTNRTKIKRIFILLKNNIQGVPRNMTVARRLEGSL